MIKKHKNKNHYLSTQEGIWVRDFTKKDIELLDLNEKLFDVKDYPLLIENELKNKMARMAPFHEENFSFDAACIVSDGYQLSTKLPELEKLGSKVCLLAINNSLNVWSPEAKRIINYYVLNNPYPSAMNHFPTRLPRRKVPPLLASIRSCPDFIKKYPSLKYQYVPVPDRNLSTTQHPAVMIDDYRNPICAAIMLAYHMKVKRIVLFCCDDCFSEERPGSIKAREGMWMYPAHQTACHIIDACAFWLKKQKVEVVDHSSGPFYEHASYITIDKVAGYLNGIEEKDE